MATPAEENLERLLRILAAHHGAAVTGVGADGRFCAVPDIVPMDDHEVLLGQSALDHVHPTGIQAALDGWQEVLDHGRHASSLITADGGDATVYVFDIRPLAESAVLVWVGGVVAGAAAENVDAPLRSRFGRIRLDILANIIDMDTDAEILLGWTPADLEGVSPAEVIHPDDLESVTANWIKILGAPGVPQRCRGRYKRHDGSYVWLEFTNTNRLDDPDHNDVLSEIADISEEMVTAEALRRREELLRRLTESLPLGVVQVDADGRIEYRNDQLLRITGRSDAETLTEQLADVVAEDQRLLDAATATCLGQGVSSSLEVRLSGPDSPHERVCQLTLRALSDARGGVEGAVVCLFDVTESTVMRRELEFRATYDPLTGCHNRASTMAALEQAIADGAGTGEGTAVIFVDLDGFKTINDTLGHAAGDHLLVTVATRLRAEVRGNDIVGRFGGDEFLVVCPSVTGPDEAMEIADRLTNAVRAPLTLGESRIDPAASAGVAWARAGSATPDELVAAADRAMYDSKRQGASTPTLADH